MDYIGKPINPVELTSRVRSALALKLEMDRRKAREAELQKLTRQLAKANQDLRLLSARDGLTGVANRRFYDEQLAKQWAHCARERVPLTHLMIDIDYFKKYNDRYGHLAGDDCLRRVAQVLQEGLKRPVDLLARYGGEEFAAVLPYTDAPGALVVGRDPARGGGGHGPGEPRRAGRGAYREPGGGHLPAQPGPAAQPHCGGLGPGALRGQGPGPQPGGPGPGGLGRLGGAYSQGRRA